MQEAGRILLMPKGDYLASTTYEMLDLVNHNDASWVCKKDCTGQEPSDSNTEYWQRFGTAVDLSEYLRLLPPAVAIPSGADLNTYLTVGTFGIESAAVAQSLLNRPSALIHGGKLVVENTQNANNFYQTIYSSDGVFRRYVSNGTFNNWETLFTTAGGTVEVNSFNGMRVKRLADKEQWYAGIMFANNNGDLCGIASDGNGDLLKMDKSGNLVGFLIDTNNYSKYALPLTGGTITRDGSSPIELKNKSDNLSMVKFSGSGGALGWLGFDSVDKPIFRSTGAVYNTLLHTGNKPTGTYTGNGSATARTIATNGIGNVVFIKAQYGFAIVTTGGYIAMRDGSVSCGTDAYVSSGSLKISSTSPVLNADGVTYNYEVL